MKLFQGTVKPSPCPKCKGLSIGAECLPGVRFDFNRPPLPGDLTVCLKCGQLCRFTESMDIEAVSDADLLSLPPAISHQMRAMRRFVRQNVERFN